MNIKAKYIVVASKKQSPACGIYYRLGPCSVKAPAAVVSHMIGRDAVFMDVF